MTTVDQLWDSLRRTFVRNNATDRASTASSDVAGPSTSTLSSATTAVLREGQSYFITAEPLPADIAENPSFEFQRRLHLVELILGTTSHGQPLPPAHAFLDRHEPEKLAMTALMDAMCVAQVSTTSQEGRPMADRQMFVGKALRLLCWNLGAMCQVQCDRLDADTTLGAMHGMMFSLWLGHFREDGGVCEKLSQELRERTQKYHNKVHRLGWEASTSPIKPLLCPSWVLGVLCICIGIRLSAPAQALPRQPQIHANDSVLHFCTARVPQLLEQFDIVLSHSERGTRSQDVIHNLLISLGQTVAYLKRYHVQWASELPPRYWLVSIRTFRDFNALQVQPFGGLTTAYNFRSSSCELEFRISFVCLLELNQTILRTHEAFSAICALAEHRLQFAVTNSDAREAADTLCMILPWIVQNQSASFAGIHSLMPLYYAAEYYHKYECEEQLDWCERVSKALRERNEIDEPDTPAQAMGPEITISDYG